MTKARWLHRPRKAVVASLMYGPYGRFDGLDARLDELAGFVDDMARIAAERYAGRRLDIAALPEVVVCGGLSGTAQECSFPLKGQILTRMSEIARAHETYITIPLYLAEDESAGIYRNSIGLLDRSGHLVGMYHKLHPVIGHDGRTLEGGVAPGSSAPVFECDFGAVGFQICYDIGYDDGWIQLAKNGADLVVWSTQSPQTVRPASIAQREGYYVLSSTWRNNATLFEPTGMVAAQIREPERYLVTEIDLSYVVLPWSGKLANGSYLEGMYGSAVGYRYYESEDCGIFWSNDPERSIGEMVDEAGLESLDALRSRNTALQDQTRR